MTRLVGYITPIANYKAKFAKTPTDSIYCSSAIITFHFYLTFWRKAFFTIVQSMGDCDEACQKASQSSCIVRLTLDDRPLSLLYTAYYSYQISLLTFNQ